jgi:hypothetical protein
MYYIYIIYTLYIIYTNICNNILIYTKTCNRFRLSAKRTEGYWHVMMCRNVLWREQLASQLLSPQHIPTQHDMLPQHLICKYELNCEYCNIT